MSATPAPTTPTNSAGQSGSSSIPQTAAAGGVSFTQPPQTASASFYKIAPSAPITFGYTMTSLYVTPTALTFRAFCSLNGNTYDITTVAPTATSVTWDPYAYEQSPGAIPLAIATYQLQVMDERGPLAAASPGLFSPNQQVRFALYKPQPYTPLASKSSFLCLVLSPVVLSFLSFQVAPLSLFPSLPIPVRHLHLVPSLSLAVCLSISFPLLHLVPSNIYPALPGLVIPVAGRASASRRRRARTATVTATALNACWQFAHRSNVHHPCSPPRLQPLLLLNGGGGSVWVETENGPRPHVVMHAYFCPS